MRPRMKTPLLRLLRVLLVAWLFLVAMVAIFQRSLLFFPSRASEPELLAAAARSAMQPWRNATGEIIGWKSAQDRGNPAATRMLVFHGNAGYALHRRHYVDGFENLTGTAGWEVILFEYPGYGARAGALGKASFDAAAHAAVAQLLAEDARSLFLLGESIGSGPACAVAALEPAKIAGVCLVTPFSRLTEVAAHHYPFLPIRLMVRDRWDNLAALRGYPGGLAVRLAGADEVIPAKFGRTLFDSFRGPKLLWTSDAATHNGLEFNPADPWWREASDFLRGRRDAAL